MRNDEFDFCPECDHAQLPPEHQRGMLTETQWGMARKSVAVWTFCKECGAEFRSPARWIRNPYGGRVPCTLLGVILLIPCGMLSFLFWVLVRGR